MDTQSITWSMESCTPYPLSKCPLRVDGCTGIVSVTEAREGLDFETLNATELGAKVILTVVATDDGTPASKSLPQNVTVFVTDANDPPTISAQSFDVLESASIGHTVGTIQAFDPDGDTSLVFADMTTIPHPFTVEPSTGAIQVSSSLDFEGSMQSVSLRIFVTDSAGAPSAKSALILINVKDDNDAPTLASMDVFIPESCAPGSGSDAQCQVQLAGTDQDDENSPATGKGSPLSWSLSGSHVGKAGGCGDTFVLDASSGVLSANASASATPLDYERHPNGCTVWVELTDSAALTSQFEVLVRIVDVNEPPHLSEALCANPTVSENVPVGTNVTACALLIQDPDTRALPPQDVTVLQAAGAEFGLHAELTMLDHIYMTVSKHIDFETSPTITVSFFMRDDGTPVAIQDSDIVVTVIDVNEPPVFRNVDSARSISEGASPAALVTGPTLQATDPDVGQTATLKYRVAVSPSNDEHFEIQVSTGAISVRAGASLNYETNPTLNFPVTVTDSGDIAVSAIVIITVNNANDAPTINTAVVTTKIPITPGFGLKSRTAVCRFGRRFWTRRAAHISRRKQFRLGSFYAGFGIRGRFPSVQTTPI